MIRLVVADDHPIVREGVLRIVADCHDMRVVGQASRGDELLELLARQPADVLLLDISMPGPPFLDLLAGIRSTWPAMRVLVVSQHPEAQYAVRALKAGAAGYLTKDRSATELADAIRRAHSGGRYVTESLAERLATQLDAGADRSHHELLSDRELQVLAALGAGRTVKEIAGQLAVSPKTVSTYRSRVLKKLALKTTADLIRYAIEHDIRPSYT